jgi:hypothetical protein
MYVAAGHVRCFKYLLRFDQTAFTFKAVIKGSGDLMRLMALRFGICLVIIPAQSLLASDKDKVANARPAVFEELVNCRSVPDPQARLACYDVKVTAIDDAAKKDEIVLADKDSMKEARRGLFGFSIPKIRLFGVGDNEIKELMTTIRSARRDGDGRWHVELADGARWVQIDSRELAVDAKPDMPIKIRPAALGSYFANISGQTAIRMKRVN